MEEIYKRIWKLAKPYYKKGRQYDIQHIEWMMEHVDRIADIEDLDKRLLIPICILHDVGYSVMKEKNPNTKSAELKKIHMKEGAKIAKQILQEVNYDPNLSDKIVCYVSVHDNWIFGDDSPFKECKEMAAFNDLDFIYAVSSFDVVKMLAKAMNKKPEEIYDLWRNDEKLTRRPFCCKATKKLFEDYMKKLKEEIRIK